MEQKLDEKFKGGLLDTERFKKPEFFIFVGKKGVTNLLGTKEEFFVKSNLPFFIDWRYSDEEEKIEKFLKELKEWTALPKYKFLSKFNRREENKPSTYSLAEFREIFIDFNFVEVQFSQFLPEDFKTEFFRKTREIFALQRDATDEEAKDFERYWYLLNHMESIKLLIGKSHNQYSCYSDRDKDDTMQITITKQEYNNRLMDMAQEFKKLNKKYPFLGIPQIYLAEIKKKPTYVKFKKENTDELQESWDELSDEEAKEFDGDFETFCRQQFETYLEAYDFDE